MMDISTPSTHLVPFLSIVALYVYIALSKGSVLIILVILSFVMSVLPADSDQQKHAAHGIQATLFQDRCHHFRCSQREHGAAALMKYTHSHTFVFDVQWYIQ